MQSSRERKVTDLALSDDKAEISEDVDLTSHHDRIQDERVSVLIFETRESKAFSMMASTTITFKKKLVYHK